MKNRKPDDVKLTIYGFRQFGKEHFAEEFFRMLEDVDTAYIPDKIGMYEPIKTPFSIEAAKKMWVESEKYYGFFGGIILKGRKYFGDISWKNDNSNIIGLRVSRDLVVKGDHVGKFIELAQRLFLWANGVWGFVYHSSNKIYTPGMTFRTCIGGIPWMALFGPPYVKMFGREVIQSAPCKVEEFAENRFMLLTSEEPMEVTSELLKIQAMVKKHLGEDAFCRNDAPERVTMEDVLAGRDRPSIEGYRSPDLSAYISDRVRKDQGEGLVAVVNDDGTITTYEANLEK